MSATPASAVSVESLTRQFGSFTIGRDRVVAELDAHATGLLDAPVTLGVAMDRTILIDADTRRTLPVARG